MGLKQKLNIQKIKNRIIKGDLTKMLNLIPDNSIDLVITSPPYNIGKMHSNRTQYGTYANNDMDEQEYQEWQTEILNSVYRILSPNGHLFYNHKVRIKKGEAIHPLQWIFKSKFILKQEIVWDQGKGPNLDKIRFFPFSERIYWLTKNRRNKINNVELLSDVWRVVPGHKRREKKHIAVMSEDIVKIILNNLGFEPNIVFDPFCGSGTTCLIAKQKGYDFLGIEIDRELVETVRKLVVFKDF